MINFLFIRSAGAKNKSTYIVYIVIVLIYVPVTIEPALAGRRRAGELPWSYRSSKLFANSAAVELTSCTSCVCVCARARSCVRSCVRACVCMCLREHGDVHWALVTDSFVGHCTRHRANATAALKVEKIYTPTHTKNRRANELPAYTRADSRTFWTGRYLFSIFRAIC